MATWRGRSSVGEQPYPEEYAVPAGDRPLLFEEEVETLLVLAFGTRGDVEPLAAVSAAWATAKRDVEVIFVTHTAHTREAWFRAALPQTPTTLLGANSEPMAGCPRRDDRWSGQQHEACLDAAARARGRVTVLFNLLAFEGIHIADALDGACVAAHPCPMPGAAPFDVGKALQHLEPELARDQGLRKSAEAWLWPALLCDKWREFRKLAFQRLGKPRSGLSDVRETGNTTASSSPLAHSQLVDETTTATRRLRGLNVGALTQRPKLLLGFSSILWPPADDWTDAHVIVCGDWLPARLSAAQTLAKAEYARGRRRRELALQRQQAHQNTLLPLQQQQQQPEEEARRREGGKFDWVDDEVYFGTPAAQRVAASRNVVLVTLGAAGSREAAALTADKARGLYNGVLSFFRGPRGRDMRLVVQTDAYGYAEEYFAADVLAGPLDHDAVMACCAIVVHHGGAGVVHRAAKQGCAQVVVPFFADQFKWARHVQRLGLGSTVDLTMSLRADSADRVRRALVKAASLDVLSRAYAVSNRLSNVRSNLHVALCCLQMAAKLVVSRPSPAPSNAAAPHLRSCVQNTSGGVPKGEPNGLVAVVDDRESPLFGGGDSGEDPRLLRRPVQQQQQQQRVSSSSSDKGDDVDSGRSRREWAENVPPENKPPTGGRRRSRSSSSPSSGSSSGSFSPACADIPCLELATLGPRNRRGFASAWCRVFCQPALVAATSASAADVFERRVFDQFLVDSRPTALVDAGAGVGLLAVRAATLSLEESELAVVLAVEPDPIQRLALHSNLARYAPPNWRWRAVADLRGCATDLDADLSQHRIALCVADDPAYTLLLQSDDLLRSVVSLAVVSRPENSGFDSRSVGLRLKSLGFAESTSKVSLHSGRSLSFYARHLHDAPTRSHIGQEEEEEEDAAAANDGLDDCLRPSVSKRRKNPPSLFFIDNHETRRPARPQGDHPDLSPDRRPSRKPRPDALSPELIAAVAAAPYLRSSPSR